MPQVLESFLGLYYIIPDITDISYRNVEARGQYSVNQRRKVISYFFAAYHVLSHEYENAFWFRQSVSVANYSEPS